MATDLSKRVERRFGLRPVDAFVKRAFDIVFSLLGLLVLGWLIVVLAFFAGRSTQASGIFRQSRIGLYGDPFILFKLRTMRMSTDVTTTVTATGDPRITRFGAFLRSTKLDELPQLVNVLLGKMSFVGPRPDVPATYAGLAQDDFRILSIRPGITGPASLYFRREEEILASVADPEAYNRDVIFPEKVRLNLDYIRNYSLVGDVVIIARTILGNGPEAVGSHVA